METVKFKKPVEEVEEVEQPKKVLKQNRPYVVAQLPVEVNRKLINQETGESFDAVTIEEAMTEILETLRLIKKGVLG